MVDLYVELRALALAFDAAGVEFALCGGLALAVHGHPRATKDIDLLVRREQVALAKNVARACGSPRVPMAGAAIELRLRQASELSRACFELGKIGR